MRKKPVGKPWRKPGWATLFRILWAGAFSGFLVFKGAMMPVSGTFNLGLLLTGVAALFGVFTQVASARRWLYQAQMDFYQKMYTEEDWKRNGAIGASALGLAGLVLLAIAFSR